MTKQSDLDIKIDNSTESILLWAIIRKLIRMEFEIRQEILESEQRIIAKIGKSIDLTDEVSDVKDDIRLLKGIAPIQSDPAPQPPTKE